MEKLHFSIIINAPKEKVWDTMLSDKTYRMWTEPFSAGSHFIGDWSKGNKILFLGPGEGENGVSGMVARIAENRPYEFISIEHLGVVANGKEDTTSDNVKEWAGAHENYTFKELDGKTELLIDTDTAEEFVNDFRGMWPKALEKLKQIVESGV